MGKNKLAKVPMVMQMEAVECGAASLAMILAYYGKWLPLEQVRADCGVSRDGSSAKSILKAARNYGFDAKGFRMPPEALEGKQPAIIHWNFEHFVVFRGFDRKGYACLNDPGVGPVKYPLEEFRKHFTGVCLTFSPTEKFEKSGQQTSILSYIRKNMKGAREAFWLTFVFALITAFVALVTPLFTRIFLDEILSGNKNDWVPYFFTGMGAVALYQFFVVLLQSRYSKRVAGSLALKGNKEYLWHLLRLPMSFFAMRHVGDLQQRMHLNQTITHSLVEVLAPQVINVMLLVLYVALMFSYSVWLTLIGILAAAFNLLMVKYFADKRLNLTRSMEQSVGKYVSATISCRRTITSSPPAVSSARDSPVRWRRSASRSSAWMSSRRANGPTGISSISLPPRHTADSASKPTDSSAPSRMATSLIICMPSALSWPTATLSSPAVAPVSPFSRPSRPRMQFFKTHAYETAGNHSKRP